MLTTHQSHLHRELFPEEYDRMFDDCSYARLRGQGVNPMSKDYIDRVNDWRLAMGVRPYIPTQQSPEHHHRAMENPAFIDSHDYIVLHHPDNIAESELLRIPRQHVERVLSCSGMVLIADTLDWFVKIQERLLSQPKGHDVRAIVPLAQHSFLVCGGNDLLTLRVFGFLQQPTKNITEALCHLWGRELLFKKAKHEQLIRYQVGESAKTKKKELGEIRVKADSNSITLQGIEGMPRELELDGDFEPHVIGGRGMAGNMAQHLIVKKPWKQRALELAEQAKEEG